MSLDRPDPKSLSPSDLKMHLGMMQQALDLKEAELLRRSLELEKIQAELHQRETIIERRDDIVKQQAEEIADLRIKLEVAKTKAEQGQKKSPIKTRFLAFLVYVLSQSPNVQEKNDKNIELDIMMLYENVKIGRGTMMMLEEMMDLRNKIASGNLEGNITSDIARDFIVNAVGIDSLLSFKPSIPSP